MLHRALRQCAVAARLLRPAAPAGFGVKGELEVLTVVARLTATVRAPLSNACRASSAIWEPPAASPTTRN